MKKWMFVFTALFVAIGAFAQNLKSYIPADAMIVGAANGTAIMESKFIQQVILVTSQKSMETLLKESGMTMEQAKKECGISLFYLKMTLANADKAPVPQFAGGCIIQGVAKDSFKSVNNITQKYLDDTLKKNAEMLSVMQAANVKFELVKFAGKNNAVKISMPSPTGHGVINAIVLGMTDRTFQVIFGENQLTENNMLKPLKQYSALTKKVDTNALMSLAMDIQSFVKMIPQQQQDPVAASIKTVSATISEVNNNLILQAKIETISPDAANMIHAQLNAVFATMKNNPDANAKAMADMIKLDLKGSNVELKGTFPVEFIINLLKTALANVPQMNTPAATPANK